MNNCNSIKKLPVSERPYEKFLSKGADKLSDAELLSIILKTGTQKSNSVQVATEILKGKNGNLLNLYSKSLEELREINGIGQIKAIQLKALAELSMRISQSLHFMGIQLDSPGSIADYYMERMRHQVGEIVIAAYFNSKMHLISDRVLAQGSLNCAYIQPTDVIRPALELNATTIVLLHNHPSGDSSPSQTDVRMTTRINEAISIMGLYFGDHIIIGDMRYYSFRENNHIT